MKCARKYLAILLSIMLLFMAVPWSAPAIAGTTPVLSPAVAVSDSVDQSVYDSGLGAAPPAVTQILQPSVTQAVYSSIYLSNAFMRTVAGASGNIGTLNATGGIAPFTFSCAGAPSWVTVGSSGVVSVSGVPKTAAHRNQITVTVTDSNGSTASAVLTIFVGRGTWSKLPYKMGVSPAPEAVVQKHMKNQMRKLTSNDASGSNVNLDNPYLSSSNPTSTGDPSSENWSANMPPVGDQGQEGCCTAFATTYLKGYEERLNRSWNDQTPIHEFSPSYVYNQLCGGVDNGLSFNRSFDLMINQGVDTLNDFPYEQGDYMTQPAAAQIDRAANFKSASYSIIFANNNPGTVVDVTPIKDALTGGPVVAGTYIYWSAGWDDINDGNVALTDIPVGDVSAGGHAVCLVGYDDNHVTDDGLGAFKFINSWGPGWGQSGYGWISYAYASEYFSDAATMTDLDNTGNVTYSVSGQALNSATSFIPGATLAFTGSNAPASVVTDVYGLWSQSGFAEGQTYTVTPSLSGTTFHPSSYIFTSNYATPDALDFSTQASIPTSVTVTSPTAGTDWTQGKDASVEWDSTGTPGYIQVWLDQNGQEQQLIGESGTVSDNQGAADITVPDVSSGSNYQIVLDATESGVTSTSPDFTIGTIAVTGVSLDKNTGTIAAGGTDQLTATVQPGNAANLNVTWSSDTQSVATVSQTGLVMAIAPGTDSITVTTADGGFTATCVVTVDPVHVTGISLNKSTDTITAGDRDQLTVTITPGNATDRSVTWASDNEGVATVSQGGLVSAVAPGTADITVTTADGGFVAICTATIQASTAGGGGGGGAVAPASVAPVTPVVLTPVVVPAVTPAPSNVAPIGSAIPVPNDLQGSWAFAQATALLNKGIITGYPDKTFRPNVDVTRAEFAAMLVKAIGLTASGKDSQFTDVDADAWYSSAVNTAVAHWLLSGIGNGQFAPNDLITREQMAVMIFNAMNALNITASAGDISKYSDHNRIDSWAVQAMSSCVGTSLMNGMADGTLAPQGDATRAQAAVIVYNLLNKAGR